MTQKISIFSSNLSNTTDIYVNNLTNEIKEIFNHLGGPKKVSEILTCKYSKSKEWALGRAPISIKELNLLLESCKTRFKSQICARICSKDVFLSCRYSPTKIKMPIVVSPDLAYLTGIILGDGCISMGQKDKKKVWFLGVYFDNKEHQRIFDDLMGNEFLIKVKHAQRKPKCFESYVNSKTLNWFFCNTLGLPHGKKSDRICTPKLIEQSEKETKSAFMQGLFDSDGSITKKGNIRFSTTSRRMAYEMQEMLYGFGIESSISSWLKHKKYLMLYTVGVKGKNGRKYFAKFIGFRHPIKKLLLSKFS